MKVAAVIVNWNGGGLLARCLESLAAQRRPPDHVIVVDNGSTDESLRTAAAWLRECELIRLPLNVGFARANNIAAEVARSFDALALLNPDAFADAGWLEALVAAAERDPRTAAFASRIEMADDPRYFDGVGDSYHVSGRAWRNGHGARRDGWPAIDGEVFGPCAAAALYRREAFEDVGGFDEEFFCYFEDVDLAFRLRLRGHCSVYVHSAVVRHVSSATTGYRSDFAVYHGERNLVWTFFKNMPAPLLWMYLPQHVFLNIAALAYYPLRGQGGVVWRAKLDALRSLPSMLERRRAVQRDRLVDLGALRRSFKGGVLAPYVRRYGNP